MSDYENQTQFSQTQPLQENPVILPIEPEELLARQRKKRLILFISGTLFLALVVAIGLSFLKPPSPDKSFISATDQPTPAPIVDTSLRGRIKSAQKELEAIGQTEYQLPLPQVNFDLRLEEKRQ